MLRTKKENWDYLTDETENIQLNKISDSQRQLKIRYEQILETEVFEHDTIHSIAIRNNCLVSDIKRLNKIIQDNEIHAFHTIKVPLTAHNILVDTLPKVHKSGNNSPKTTINPSNSSSLDCKEKLLEEKLLLASVSNAVIRNSDLDSGSEDENHPDSDLLNEPLLLNNMKQFRGYPKSIKIPKNDFLTFNGSDCELSWVFLLIVILAFCVIIPLIYVYAVYEHPENFNHSHVKYNDVHLKNHIEYHNITNH